MTDHQKLIMAIRGAKGFRASTCDLLQDFPAQDAKSHIVLRLISVALQHHCSIALLLEWNNPSSAMALVRCIIDTCQRGIWIAAFADDNQVKQIAADEYKYGNIASDLQVVFGIGLTKEERDMLHSFTHSGYEQLVNQLSLEGQIEPEFDPRLLTAALYKASFWVFTLCVSAFALFDREDLAGDIRKSFENYFHKGDRA